MTKRKAATARKKKTAARKTTSKRRPTGNETIKLSTPPFRHGRMLTDCHQSRSRARKRTTDTEASNMTAWASGAQTPNRGMIQKMATSPATKSAARVTHPIRAIVISDFRFRGENLLSDAAIDKD